VDVAIERVSVTRSARSPVVDGFIDGALDVGDDGPWFEVT
jgi:hypothetical protein